MDADSTSSSRGGGGSKHGAERWQQQGQRQQAYGRRWVDSTAISQLLAAAGVGVCCVLVFGAPVAAARPDGVQESAPGWFGPFGVSDSQHVWSGVSTRCKPCVI